MAVMMDADRMTASGRRSTNKTMADPHGGFRTLNSRAARRCDMRRTRPRYTRVSESRSDGRLPEIPRCSSRPVDRRRMLSCEIPVADDMAAMRAVKLCRMRSKGLGWLFFLA